MPRPVDPISHRVRCVAALATTLAFVTGCAQEGDFGRPKPGAWNGLIETTGTLAAGERGEPASAFPLTDDEVTLRDRAWRFLMPAAGHDAFTDILANLTRSRVLPRSWRPDAPAAYYATLMDGPFRSPVSRYHRLSEDIGIDARLLPVFAATAARVIQADALRLRSLPFAKSLDDRDVRQAALRVAENRCLVAWVRTETDLRIARYRYAFEHLLAVVPSPEGALVERTLRALEERRPILAPLVPREAEESCGLREEGVAVEAAAAPARPLVVKN